MQSPSQVQSPSMPAVSAGGPYQNAGNEEPVEKARSPHSSQADSGLEGEPKDGKSIRGSKYTLSLDGVNLLKVIYDMLEIDKEKVQMSKH